MQYNRFYVIVPEIEYLFTFFRTKMNIKYIYSSLDICNLLSLSVASFEDKKFVSLLHLNLKIQKWKGTCLIESETSKAFFQIKPKKNSGEKVRTILVAAFFQTKPKKNPWEKVRTILVTLAYSCYMYIS